MTDEKWIWNKKEIYSSGNDWIPFFAAFIRMHRRLSICLFRFSLLWHFCICPLYLGVFLWRFLCFSGRAGDRTACCWLYLAYPCFYQPSPKKVVVFPHRHCSDVSWDKDQRELCKFADCSLSGHWSGDRFSAAFLPAPESSKQSNCRLGCFFSFCACFYFT